MGITNFIIPNKHFGIGTERGELVKAAVTSKLEEHSYCVPSENIRDFNKKERVV